MHVIERFRRPGVFFRAAGDQNTRTIADILRDETVGGMLMLLATVAALLWANLNPAGYQSVRERQFGPMDIAHWASSGVLTIFFFVAALELKREFVSGSLAKPAQAVVPIVAAICGMAIPAAVYLAINLFAPGGDLRGWAVPVATDIAFAMAILAAAGSRLPPSLRAFLLTLAIVDDLGAIIIIAVMFTSDLNLVWLGGAALCLALWWFLQRRRVIGWYWYLPLAVLTWWFVYASGVHPTIAGVALGLLCRCTPGDSYDPVDRWQHVWRPISAGSAVPVFALFSAGVNITASDVAGLFGQPSALGIICGLIVGKFVGVLGGAIAITRLTRARLPPDLRRSELVSATILAGVGFTVAIFIAELTFADQPTLANQATLSVLIGSTVSSILAVISLRRNVSARGRQGAAGGAGS